jgi:hypothetical protein
MTLVISKGITLRKGYIGTDDPDAEAYIAAVEAADEAESPGVGALETATKVAIHSFVKGCKNDGIWPAIKASCIMAGARTLEGALVPLVGTAPTNVGGLFVSDDYDRKTGLVGDGSTKYLDSNRNNNADPQNSKHIAAYISTLSTLGFALIGTESGEVNGSTQMAQGAGELGIRLNSAASSSQASPATGFAGASRSTSTGFIVRNASTNTDITVASQAGTNQKINIYRRTVNPFGTYVNSRLAFYSIGESLDLALLDARVTDLVNAIGAAIP